MDYKTKIDEAIALHRKYGSKLPSISDKLGRNLKKHNPNLRVIYVAQNFLYAGGSLADQILRALKQRDVLIAMIGLRSIFEMSVNAVYIFRNPRQGRNQIHIRKCCKEIIRLSNKKRRVNHIRFNGTNFQKRLEEVNMRYLYSRHYRIMSDWAHLMTHTLRVATNKSLIDEFGLSISSNCLYWLHNIYDSISHHCQYNLDPNLQVMVVEYNDSAEKIVGSV